MKVEEKLVKLIKLSADKGKILVSKTLDEDGNPTVKEKEVYLAINSTEDDYEEVDDVENS